MTRFFLLILTAALGLSFRVSQKTNPWGLTVDDPTLYLEVCDEASSKTFSTQDIPTLDPYGAATMQTARELVETVAADVNAVATSFLNIEVVDTGTTVPEDRKITYCPENYSVGAAFLDWQGGVVKGCRIAIGGGDHDLATRAFTGLFAHELGHCLGFIHPQDTRHGVLSYFNDDRYRLDVDDKMGLTYLYPTAESEAVEATLGLSCAPEG